MHSVTPKLYGGRGHAIKAHLMPSVQYEQSATDDCHLETLSVKTVHAFGTQSIIILMINLTSTDNIFSCREPQNTRLQSTRERNSAARHKPILSAFGILFRQG